MNGWFITTCVTVVAQILVALGATLIAGPGFYPEYDEQLVRSGVFVLAAVPILDVLRQVSAARAHRSKKYAKLTSPLRWRSVGIALGTAAATVVVGLTVPWLAIPVFVVLAIVLLIAANT